ncbi:MAG: hypothetical protein SGI83_01775 [Bacteroidota bacterium]|nr:hypothetical protein [Bacteroidota bacterium]
MQLLTLILGLLLSTLLQAQHKFTHTTDLKNSSGNSTYLSFEGLNNNPNAIIIVEYDGITRAANPHAVGVWYDGIK